jgi:beta-glucanase (GH16 family)
MEFLGQDTSQVLLNVYFNPGSQAGGWNYGNRGTPVLVKLGFDASAAFHTYAIEWEPHEIRWFADGQLLHARPMWAPTPVPALPMQFFINLWPSRSEELAGPFDEAQLPVEAQVAEVAIAEWSIPVGN